MPARTHARCKTRNVSACESIAAGPAIRKRIAAVARVGNEAAGPPSPDRCELSLSASMTVPQIVNRK
jgi:hypothetical protein